MTLTGQNRILTPGKDWTISPQDAGRGASEPLRSRYIVLRIIHIMLTFWSTSNFVAFLDRAGSRVGRKYLQRRACTQPRSVVNFFVWGREQIFSKRCEQALEPFLGSGMVVMARETEAAKRNELLA